MADADLSNKELFRQLQELLTAAENRQEKRADGIETKIEAISSDLNSWRPRLESRVDALQSAVHALQQQAARPPPDGTSTSSTPRDLAVLGGTDAQGNHERASLLGARPHGTDLGGDLAATHLADALRAAERPLPFGVRSTGTDLGQGHGNLTLNRGLGIGTSSVPVPTPGTGTNNFQTPFQLRSNIQSDASVSTLFSQLGQTNPSLQFPVFDGENPQMWQTLAEHYFSMFSVHESYWVSMAILNFAGAPKIWLHSVRKKLGNIDWTSFCTLICTRFGRDKH